jgi:hypothetical protein
MKVGIIIHRDILEDHVGGYCVEAGQMSDDVVLAGCMSAGHGTGDLGTGDAEGRYI